MAYDSLKELYYGNQEIFQKEYTQRFSSENAVHIDFDIAGHPAFFVQCEDSLKRIYRILQLDKEISELKGLLPKTALEQYSRKCLIDEIVITNNIEGVHSSRKQIKDVLDTLEEQSEKKGRKDIFFGLVNKYLKLLGEEKISLRTSQDVRNIYDEIVLDEVVVENKHNVPDGELFRKDMAEVYAATGKKIHSGKYPESEIISYMEKALRFLNDADILPLFRICIFHYMIEYIHPFYDGNGRLGRFILSYCISENLEKLLAFRISETIKENIKKYYNAFSVCNDPRNMADLTPFVLMMLEMIEISMEELRHSLKEKQMRLEHYRGVTADLPSSHRKEFSLLYNVLVQAALFSEQGISTQELLAILHVSRPTLEKKLSAIRAQNLLTSEKNGTKNFYALNLQALDNISI